MPEISTSTTSPGRIGREFAGVPVRTTSPGSSVISRQRSASWYATGKMRSSAVASCTTSPFRYVRSVKSVGSNWSAGDELGPEREEAVVALDAQHRAAVGVAEVVHADVVRARVAADVVEHLVDRHALHPRPHDHRELALVVEELRALRHPHRLPVAVQRRRRLHEVRRLRRRPRGVLAEAAPVGQVDGEDLRRARRREVVRRRLLDPRAVGEHDLVADDRAPALVAVDLDPDAAPVGLQMGRIFLDLPRAHRLDVELADRLAEALHLEALHREEGADELARRASR